MCQNCLLQKISRGMKATPLVYLLSPCLLTFLMEKNKKRLRNGRNDIGGKDRNGGEEEEEARRLIPRTFGKKEMRGCSLFTM